MRLQLILAAGTAIAALDAPAIAADKPAVLTTYANIAEASYADSRAAAGGSPRRSTR